MKQAVSILFYKSMLIIQKYNAAFVNGIQSIKNKLSSQDVWKRTNLHVLNDPLSNGIGVCLYEVHVCGHKITYMLRLAGSTLMFGISLAPG